MKKAELTELIREEVIKIVTAHNNKEISDEEYVTRMEAYNEIAKTLND